jgi:hypothetical protein
MVSGYDYVGVTLTLSKKVGEEYVTVDNIEDYVSGIRMYAEDEDPVSIPVGTGPSVTAHLYRTEVNPNSIESVFIDFDVKTGDALTVSGIKYSNYMITLLMELETRDGNEYISKASAPTDYIKYTNARINPDFIEFFSGGN